MRLYGRAAADAWIKQAAFNWGVRQAHESKRRILIERRRAAEAAQR